MHKGSCLCGTVKYEVRGELGSAIYCHCSRCRKATATAFAVNAAIAANDFVVIEGEASLKAFDSSPGVHRVFCANCGSPIISRRDTMPDVGWGRSIRYYRPRQRRIISSPPRPSGTR